MKLRSLSSLAPLALLCLLAPVVEAQNQLTVDPFGGGQFTELQAAIDFASEGDILILAPGSHGSAVMAKRLRLLGFSGGTFNFPSITSLQVIGPSSFTLSQLAVGRLHVVGVSGRSEISRCHIGGNSTPWAFAHSAFHIEAAADLLISRTTISSTSTGLYGFHGVFISYPSNVQLVQCQITGGNGLFGDGIAGGGGAGIVIGDGSRVWLVDTTIEGGAGSDIVFPIHCITIGCDKKGQGGPAVALTGATAQLTLLGSSEKNYLRGGLGDPLGSSPPWSGQAVQCWPYGPGESFLITHPGGLVLIGGTAGCPVIELPLVPPRLTLQQTPPFGLLVEAHLHSQAGLPVMFAASFDPVWTPNPGFPLLLTPLLVDPNTLVVLKGATVTDPAIPAVFTIAVPGSPVFMGKRLHLQGFLFDPAFGIWGSNAQAIVIH